MNDTVARDIQKRCRFVFQHRGGTIGLTHDGALANEARRALIPVRQYERAPGGRTEWEIIFAPEAIEDPDAPTREYQEE